MNNLGLAQTGGTCWFHSALNLFLLTDDGFKILWAKLQDVYKHMTPTYKAWFESNINAPCPPRLKSLTTINSVYFWKFLDQYMCSIGGPGRLWRKHERNANLISRVKWNNPALANKPVNAGGTPRYEIPKLLRHIGFKQGEYIMLDWKGITAYRGPPANRNYKFFMYRKVDPYDMPLEKGPWRLSGALFVLFNRAFTSGHVWTCIRKGSKGYVFDSAKPNTLHACNWWIQTEVEDFFTNSNLIQSWGPNYQGMRGGFDVIMYSRSSYVDAIAPSCRRVYRAVTKNIENTIANLTSNNPNVGQKVENMNLPPAVKAELRKYEATRVNINSATLNAIVRNAVNYKNSLQVVSNLERAGYRVPNKNKPNSNWSRFRTALRNKFARPLPSMWYRFALAQNTRNEAMNELPKLANYGGYIINKNSNNYKNFLRKLNAKFPTRVLRSVKRKRVNRQVNVSSQRQRGTN